MINAEFSLPVLFAVHVSPDPRWLPIDRENMAENTQAICSKKLAWKFWENQVWWGLLVKQPFVKVETAEIDL